MSYQKLYRSVTKQGKLMTRINIVPVRELSDQHLLVEYRELPRVIKGSFDLRNAPLKYCLGKGHVKWAKKYSSFVLERYCELCEEMVHRGFTVNYPYTELVACNKGCGERYNITAEDIELNRDRLRSKYQLKSDWYKWTNRDKPEWIVR